jgi:PKD repeat protein
MNLSNYPENFDTNKNLYEVHDYLRVYLAEDYTPGDSKIYVYGTEEAISRFPDQSRGGGILTLTDQCEEIKQRATSFYYTTKTITSSTTAYFSGLNILSGFEDVKKYKDITNITQNVMAEHHNSLKDAVINIEKFAGVKGERAIKPLEGTIEQRTNYLRYLVLAPKAWFSVDKRIGLKPITVSFTDLSFRLGTDGTSKSTEHKWNFNYGSNNYFAYKKYFNFKTLGTGEVLTTVSIEITETFFPETYVLQKSTDDWETYIDVGNSDSFDITYSSTRNNPKYRLLIGDGGDVIGGLTVYLNLDQDKLVYTYENSGFNDASLTVTNDFGSDTCVLKNIVNVRDFCPSEAEIEFAPGETQTYLGQEIVIDGCDSDSCIKNNRLYRITSPINTYVAISIAADDVGVLKNGQNSSDPINSYTWGINDDLAHLNQSYTTAAFSVGGIYDVVLRTDTYSGNYRITNFKSSIDVIENSNLWLWTKGRSSEIISHEFGLISETFKTLNTPFDINPYFDSSFLGDVDIESGCDCGTKCCDSCYSYSEKCRTIREFERNNGFAKMDNYGSGDKNSSGLIFWATGRGDSDPVSDERIFFQKYSAFYDVYSAYYLGGSSISRQWGWAGLSSGDNLYFILGNKGVGISTCGNKDCSNPAVTSMSNETHQIDTSIISASISNHSYSRCCLNSNSFKNGAEDIKNYTLPSDSYSFQRSTWRDGSGYVLQNSGEGKFFRLKSFYKTSGTTSNPISEIKKINDLSGPTKTEGQLVNLSSAIFLFNNSGAISVFNSTTGVWSTGGPGVGSTAFKSLQDPTVTGFDDLNQTLFATSDEDHNVYISYDYSTKSFIKFNDIDLTFRYLGGRPGGEGEKQWLSTIY